MNDTVTYIILIAILIIALMVAPQLRMRTAIPRIIRAFIKAKAIDANSAKSFDELDLRDTPTTPSLLGGGDTTQKAKQILIDAKIIQSTSDSKWFISENNLAYSKWGEKPKGDKS